MLAGAINNIQVSWVKLNRELSQLCLHAGANDYGGTLMEENISREAGATAGQYTSPEDFQSLILEAGRIPAERNTTYTRIKIKAPIAALTAEQSLEPNLPSVDSPTLVRHNVHDYRDPRRHRQRRLRSRPPLGPRRRDHHHRFARRRRAQDAADKIMTRVPQAKISGADNIAACIRR